MTLELAATTMSVDRRSLRQVLLDSISDPHAGGEGLQATSPSHDLRDP